ncbi:MAG: cytochrome C oxidase subunit IV family protein [Myxococcota bacterium]
MANGPYGIGGGVVYLPIAKGLMISALIGMAIAKAALVAIYYMHLKRETKILRWTVFGCLFVPAFYALVLVSEGAWRMLG